MMSIEEFKPFPMRNLYQMEMERLRWKVNDIIDYFNGKPISCSKTKKMCKISVDNFENTELLGKAISILSNINWINTTPSIDVLSSVIREIRSNKSRKSICIMTVLYFVRGFLYDYENNPQDAFFDYCQCLAFITKEDLVDDIIYNEFEFLLNGFTWSTEYGKARAIVFKENFYLVYFTIIPALSLMRPSEVLTSMKYIGEGLFDEKEYLVAKKYLLKVIDFVASQDVLYYTLSIVLKISICYINLKEFPEALEFLNKWYNKLKPGPDEEVASGAIDFLRDIGDTFLQLNKAHKAIGIIEGLAKLRQKFYGSCGPTPLSVTISDCIPLVLCGLKIKDENIIDKYVRPILHPKFDYDKFGPFFRVLRTQIFQSNIPTLMNILQTKQKTLQVEKKKCRKCSRFKCRHFKNEHKSENQATQPPRKVNWRLFRNSILIGYFARKSMKAQEKFV